MSLEPTSGAGKCIFCADLIDTATAFRRVSGFERGRNRPQGGTNAIALRATTNEWACRRCIDKQKRGVSPEQGSLL